MQDYKFYKLFSLEHSQQEYLFVYMCYVFSYKCLKRNPYSDIFSRLHADPAPLGRDDKTLFIPPLK